MKQKIYLDSSIPSRYHDDKRPEEKRVTQLWWKNDMPKYETSISELTMEELRATPDIELRKKLLGLVDAIRIIEITDEARALTGKYLESGAMPEKYNKDALHIAIATVDNIDIVVSWNFEHMVNVETRHKVNGVNLLNEYSGIEISSPYELGGGRYVK